MRTGRKMLIATILVAMILLNCILPVVKVGAKTDVRVTFESNLYLALKDELARQEINAVCIDEQRTIVIDDEEIAKVTELSLNNSELTDLTGLETFKNLSILDLSSNELTTDSNLEVLNSLNLSTLDLSSNGIEDVSMITNFDNIPNVSLHNQKFDVVNIIEVDTSKTSDQITQVQYALPQILSKAGYLQTEWLIEETNGEPYINWSRFDHKNLKIEVAYKNGSVYEPYKSMVTLRIRISDSTNMLYNSDINMFFIVVDSDERGIHIADENMYNAIKEQLTKNQTVNSELISYYNTTPNSLKRNLYERVYDEAQVLVITIDDIVNKIPCLNLSNKKIEKLDGIEKFVGLEKELDLSGNYIKSIDKLIELQENQIVEEQKLRERVREQLALISDTINKMNPINASINTENKVIEGLQKEKAELEKKLATLETELETLRNEKAKLESDKEGLASEVAGIQAEIDTLNTKKEGLTAHIAELQKGLVTDKARKETLEQELAKLQEELADIEAGKTEVKEQIQLQIEQKKVEIDSVKERISGYEADLANVESEINAINEQLSLKEQDISTKTNTIAEYEVAISNYNVAIAEIQAEIEATSTVLALEAFADVYTTEEEKEEKIDGLIADLKVIYDESGTPDWDETAKNAETEDARLNLSKIYFYVNAGVEEIVNTILDLNSTKTEITARVKELEIYIDEAIAQANEYIDTYEPNDVYNPGDTGAILECKMNFYKGIKVGLTRWRTSVEGLELVALEFNTDYVHKVNNNDTISSLLEEKERIEDEIVALEAEIEELEKEITDTTYELPAKKAELEAEKVRLETDIASANSTLTNLQNQLKDLYAELQEIEENTDYEAIKEQADAKKTEIEEKELEIERVKESIVMTETAIINCQAELEKTNKEIEEKQKVITEKQNELKAKETALTEKENQITAKIAEIAEIISQINTKNESIAASQLKILALQQNYELLNEILADQMARLYKIYNRVDKLDSFAIPELKTITEEELENLTYEEAKAMFNNQIAKITAIEDNLTSFERKYLIKKYNIPEETTTTVEKLIQNEDGTTSKVTETKTEEIEKPISTYFKNLSTESELWNLSDYKYYLNNFRTDDVYFSMATYCYFVRLFEGMTTCQAEKYVEIEIENLEFDGENTNYLVDAMNNYETLIEELNYTCSGTPGTGLLFSYATRMLQATADIDTYVCLPRLKSLNIRENLIENIDRISELTELRELNAYDNEIVDISTVDWASMTKLRVMDLGYNGISNIKPLEALSAIETLYVDENLVAGSLDFDISKLENLRYLDLSENQIDDIGDLIKYLTFEARANGYDDVMDYLTYGNFQINIQNQMLSITVDKKLELNETEKVDLPKIFRQIEEIDSENTSFGINSLYGNVTNDGKQVILNTTREGNFNAQVSMTSTDYTYGASIASGTICTINYTVGTLAPVSVTIKSETTEVNVGETLSFTAEVAGDNISYRGVKWEIEGATSDNTTISEGGLLTVASDETSDKILVRATSVYDESKSAEVEVTIIKKQVTGVTITPASATMFRGETLEFTAEVQGENLEDADKGIKWDVLVEETNPSLAEGTKASLKDNKLTLTIGQEETIKKFIIVAKSELDETKVVEAIVTIGERTVSNVSVTPETASVEKGKTQAFTATVTGENLRDEDKGVTYSISGNTSNNTKISETGVLTVSSNEKAETIKVTVTSKFDNTKSAEVTVTITTPESKYDLGYDIDEDYVVGVATKTPVDAFKEIFAKDYTVVVKENNTVVTTGYMKTGMYVEVQDENGNTLKDEDGTLLVYEVIVKGDVNSDGVADAIDSSLIKAIRNEVGTVTDVQMKAADIDDNGEVDLLDSKLLLYHRAEVKDYCLDYTK